MKTMMIQPSRCPSVLLSSEDNEEVVSWSDARLDIPAIRGIVTRSEVITIWDFEIYVL